MKSGKKEGNGFQKLVIEPTRVTTRSYGSNEALLYKTFCNSSEKFTENISEFLLMANPDNKFGHSRGGRSWSMRSPEKRVTTRSCGFNISSVEMAFPSPASKTSSRRDVPEETVIWRSITANVALGGIHE